MSPVAAEVDELWSAVGDPTRRRVLDVLLDRGEATATILAGELPVTRQAVAKHLAVLGRAGLVDGTRRGREMRYAIRPQRLDAATRSMVQVAAGWDARLSAIKRIAESVARAQETEHQRQEGSDDEPQDRNARRMAGRAEGAAGPREGAHPPRRRARP